MAYEVQFDGDERTFEPIPKGNYESFVNSIVEKGEGPKAYLNVRFVIADGQFKGRSLFSNCSFSAEGVWKLQNLLLACGLAKTGEKTKVQFTNEQLIGKRIGIRVAEEEYNGELRPAVKNFYALGGASAAGAPAASPATPPAPPSAPAPSGGVRRL